MSQSPPKMSQSPSKMSSQSPPKMSSQSPPKMSSQSPSKMSSQSPPKMAQSPSKMSSQSPPKMTQSSSKMSSQSPPQAGSSTLKSKLPSEVHVWLPEEILKLPHKLSYSHKDLLLRKYGLTELHWASLTGSVEDIGNFLNRASTSHTQSLKATPFSDTTSSLRKRKSSDGHEIHGATALFLAARSGVWPSVVDMLLKHGADQDILKPNQRGDTALHAAALSGNATIMKMLLDALGMGEASVDTKGYMRRTPLHYAAGFGHTEVIKLLLKSNASKTAKDVNGATPFHFAVAWVKNSNALELLVPDNDVDMTDSKGRTALHYAASKGHVQSLIWLVDHGANFNAQDSTYGDTPLHVGTKYLEVIQILISHKANIWERNKLGQLPIAAALALGNTEAVKEFVKAIQQHKDVDPMVKPNDDDDAGLLHYIAGYGSDVALEWIIALLELPRTPRHESDIINVRDGNGRTAVHWAAAQGNVSVLRVLVRKKADLFAVDAKGQSAIGVAIACGKNMEFVNAFMELPIVMYQARSRVLCNHEEAARWMREYYSVHDLQMEDIVMKIKAQIGQKGTKITIDPFEEFPPIYLALNAGRDDIAEFMQKHSKDEVEDAVNKQGDITGRTALHWATLLKNEAVVRKLVIELFAKELKPNLEDKDGKTALEYANQISQKRIEKLLMESCQEIKTYMEGLYRDRQLYVDAANAELMAAALIASVTFMGWLQPPLNYEVYYDLAVTTPSGSANAIYAAVQQNKGVRAFWAFNSLAFMFSIATVLSGLICIIPIRGRYITRAVEHIRISMIVTSINLALSILFVLGSFSAAGFSVLPPIFKYRANMLATVIVGGTPCVMFLVYFVIQAPLVVLKGLIRMEAVTNQTPPPPPLPSSVLNPSRPWEFDDFVTLSKRGSKKSIIPKNSLTRTDSKKSLILKNSLNTRVSKRSIPFLSSFHKMDSRILYAIPKILNRKETKVSAPLINNFFQEEER